MQNATTKLLHANFIIPDPLRRLHGVPLAVVGGAPHGRISRGAGGQRISQSSEEMHGKKKKHTFAIENAT